MVVARKANRINMHLVVSKNGAIHFTDIPNSTTWLKGNMQEKTAKKNIYFFFFISTALYTSTSHVLCMEKYKDPTTGILH